MGKGNIHIKIRLYRQHDLDLLGLYYHPSFNIKKAMYAVMAEESRGIPQFILLPPPYLPIEPLGYSKQFHVELNPEKDLDILVWLKKIQVKMRNSFLKNLLRKRILPGNSYLDVYFHEVVMEKQSYIPNDYIPNEKISSEKKKDNQSGTEMMKKESEKTNEKIDEDLLSVFAEQNF